MSRTMTQSRKGVTLIEMMIVVVMLSIISAMAMPKINLAQFRTDDSVRGVRAMLQTAQRLAITRQYDVIVSFDTVGQRVRMVEDLNNNYLADAGERTTWLALDQGVTFSVPSTGVAGAVGASIVGANIVTVNSMPSVIFLRSGSASSNLEVYLTSVGNEGPAWRAVQVTQSTGRTVWYRWLATLWNKASV